MSKREHNELITELQPIFYAPLTQGDITDHVSGTQLIANNGATYTWNSNENAYYFNLTNALAAETGIQFPDVNIEFSTTQEDIECTRVVDIKVPNSVVSGAQFMILSTKYYYWDLDWYGGRNSRGKWIRLSSIKKKGEIRRLYYEDNRFILEATDKNPVLTRLNTYLLAKSSWAQPFSCYVKNAYIFGKALTLEQITTL